MITDVELTTEAVSRVIDEKIRPLLQAHGGDLVLEEVRGHNVKVRFVGACSSCPSLKNTMDEIVTGALKEEFKDQIDRVILWDSVSDDLIEMARSYLNHSTSRT